MGHIVAIMTLVLGMLMLGNGAASAASAELERISAQVSDVRSGVHSLREQGRAVGQRMTSMASRLAGMRARLEAQQHKMAKMQAQLKSINALIGKVAGIKVAQVTAASPDKVTPSATPAPSNTVVAAASAPVAAKALAVVTQPLVGVTPAGALANSVSATGSGSTAAPLVQLNPAPATLSAPAPEQVAPAAPITPQASTTSAALLVVDSWLTDLSGVGLIAAGWLALVVLGSAIVLRRRGQSAKRAEHKDRDAELREKVSRKAAENLSDRGLPKAASFAVATGEETHGGDAPILDARPVPGGVAGAVRDSDIYVAYGEIDAARNALS